MAEQHLSRPAGGTPAEVQETRFDHDWMLEPFAHLDGGLASRLADLSRIASAVDAIARVLEGSAVQNDFDGGQGLAASTLGGLHSALRVISSAADASVVGLAKALEASHEH
jgi:hypothetical protein